MATFLLALSLYAPSLVVTLPDRMNDALVRALGRRRQQQEEEEEQEEETFAFQFFFDRYTVVTCSSRRLLGRMAVADIVECIQQLRWRRHYDLLNVLCPPFIVWEHRPSHLGELPVHWHPACLVPVDDGFDTYGALIVC